MIKKILYLLIFLLMATFALGCVSTFSHKITPGTDLTGYRTFYLEHLPADKRMINLVIKGEMEKLGLATTTGPASAAPKDVDVTVTYEDRWMWDMTMYMLSLKIDLYHASTKVLLATGQTSYSSLIRKSPEFMAREILEAVFVGRKEPG